MITQRSRKVQHSEAYDRAIAACVGFGLLAVIWKATILPLSVVWSLCLAYAWWAERRMRSLPAAR